MSRYLINTFRDLERKLENKKISLFFDYDGTLTPIAGTPEEAVLFYRIKELLKKLLKRYPTAIISGRNMNDLRDKVAIEGLVYAGNHGFEIYSKDFTFHIEQEKEFKTEIIEIAEKLKTSLKGFKGSIVENKGITISVHYRLVHQREVHQLILRVKKDLIPYIDKKMFRFTKGKKVLEIRPTFDWDKGKAVRWILEQDRFKDTLPIYVGDDETDRDAFRELQGIGIFVAVGHKWPEVDYFLKAQGEVKRFLEWLSFF